MDVMIWNDLPHIDDVNPNEDSDSRCLEEIRSIVERYGKEKRFGVTLLHHHFRLASDEVLVEHCDVEQRSLTTSPVKISEFAERHFRPTVWRFDGNQTHICAYCPTTEDDEGRQRHTGYKDSH